MIYTCKPTKVSIYDNRKTRYTAAKVKAITGADIVFNGGVFDFKTLAPYCALKINGIVKVNESWVRNGFGWNDGEVPKLMSISELPNVDNFIACITAVENGAKVTMSYPPDMGGKRGRTAFGVKSDGSMVIVCTSDKAPITMEEAQDKLLAQGCISGIILDGGGSSQIISPVETITSTRIVSNFICVTLNKTDKTVPNVNDNEHKEGNKMKVCLDAGHGNSELNCSPDKQYYEYKFTWDIVNRVKAYLEQLECFDVKLTKNSAEETPTLAARANTANAFGADLFVSSHSNSVGGNGWDDTVHGLTAWIYALGGKREELAKIFLEQCAEQGIELFGTKLYTAKFAVLSKTNMPAMLIENYFHTCHSDVKKLTTDAEIDKLAYAQACAICEYFNVGANLRHETTEEKAVQSEARYAVAFESEADVAKYIAALAKQGINGIAVKENK